MRQNYTNGLMSSTGKLLNLLESYLPNEKQRVIINDPESYWGNWRRFLHINDLKGIKTQLISLPTIYHFPLYAIQILQLVILTV